mmetsp:Transcript_15954/g.41937  ORF Transcript_15954/g.41937 Transcript_15954/m.41937 type:complete len:235 (+) Transcript_15954:292-996(+)
MHAHLPKATESYEESWFLRFGSPTLRGCSPRRAKQPCSWLGQLARTVTGLASDVEKLSFSPSTAHAAVFLGGTYSPVLGHTNTDFFSSLPSLPLLYRYGRGSRSLVMSQRAIAPETTLTTSTGNEIESANGSIAYLAWKASIAPPTGIEMASYTLEIKEESSLAMAIEPGDVKRRKRRGEGDRGQVVSRHGAVRNGWGCREKLSRVDCHARARYRTGDDEMIGGVRVRVRVLRF